MLHMEGALPNSFVVYPCRTLFFDAVHVCMVSLTVWPSATFSFLFVFFFFNADICVLTTEEGEPPPLCHSASTLQWWRNATLHPRPLPFKIRSFAWALRKCRSCWPASNSTRLAVQFVDFYPRNLKQASTWSPSFAQLGWPQCRRLTEYDTMLAQE